MQINIKFTDLDLSPEFREEVEKYVEKKIASLDRYLHTIHKGEREIAVAQVEIGRVTRHHNKGDIYRAEIQILAPHFGIDLRTESIKENLYDAIDDAKKEMKRKLTKESSRRLEIIRKGARIFKRIFRR